MSDRLKSIGLNTARYGLVIVLLWIGGMKFTAYEAEGIRPLVANSPRLQDLGHVRRYWRGRDTLRVWSDRSVEGLSPRGSPAGTGRFRTIESAFGTQFFLPVNPLPCTRSIYTPYYRKLPCDLSGFSPTSADPTSARSTEGWGRSPSFPGIRQDGPRPCQSRCDPS